MQVVHTAKQVGALVRRERRKLGLTQGLLGKRVQRRQATISKLEAGQPAIQILTLLDTLAALDLEIAIRPRAENPPGRRRRDR
ncbi:MAG: helix-turn-helix domain-containing protein [Alphaproteobacteria bacterium]|nr:helix-turn-helix domain-containing protein [Alphaproteobacteria bacterium]